MTELRYPDDLRYTEEHEWVREEGSSVRVGITDFAQDALGDVVYVDLPEVGASVSAGQPLGEVESTKSVSDVYSPVSGEVTDANAAFFDAANGFAGCIAGIHEVLRRQGLLTTTRCLDPHETFGPGQLREIDRVYRAYPHLADDAFVAEHLDEWLR